MIYKSFTIQNFKGINNVFIDFRNNRILTLVGLNESGKTSIMEAIDWFYKMIKGNDPTLEMLNTFRPKGIDFTGEIIINGDMVLESEDIDKIKKFWKSELNKKSELVIPQDFSYNFHFIFSLHSYVNTRRKCTFDIKTKTAHSQLCYTDLEVWNKIIDYIKKDIIPEILYYDDFTFLIPDNIIFSKVGETQDEEVINKNNSTWQLVINDILKSVNPKLTFQFHVVEIWDKDRDAANNRLSQMEKMLDEKITSRWGNLFGKQNLNFKEIKLDVENSNSKMYLSFKIRTQSKKEFLVKERSKGFKWFFSFLLFTEFRKTRTKNILFLLDEPASNLHSSAQAKILEAILELSHNSLVIYSTHSQYLINPNWLSGSYICINENLSDDMLKGNLDISEGAKISAIKYYDYVGRGLGNDKVSYFQPILDRLDFKPSSLEPIPNIIILEGKNDWFTLKYFEETILQREKKLNFYPGSGKDKLYEIIRIYLSWGKFFLVLLDGDDGVKSKDKYVNKFGYYVSNKIFTLYDIFEKRITLEGLIEESDKKKICDSIFENGCYENSKKKGVKKLKEVLNYSLNELEFKKISLNFNKQTLVNFAKLFNFLDEKLKLYSNIG